jgi:hypothetical protein
VVAWLAAQFEGLGYTSWAHRVVCSAGGPRARRGGGLRCDPGRARARTPRRRPPAAPAPAAAAAARPFAAVGAPKTQAPGAKPRAQTLIPNPQGLACPTAASACSWSRRCTATRGTCCCPRRGGVCVSRGDGGGGGGRVGRRGGGAQHTHAHAHTHTHTHTQTHTHTTRQHDNTAQQHINTTQRAHKRTRARAPGRAPLHGRLHGGVRRRLLGVLRPRRCQGGRALGARRLQLRAGSGQRQARKGGGVIGLTPRPCPRVALGDAVAESPALAASPRLFCLSSVP